MARKTNTFKDKAEGELVKLLSEKREELRTHRFSAAGSRAKDPDAAGKIRRDIARILTEMKSQKTA